MKLMIRIGSRNIFRNKRRTLLTLSAVAVIVLAMVIMISYVTGILNDWIDNETKFALGHIKINTEKYITMQKVYPLHLAIHNVDGIVNTLLKEPDVVSVSPRIWFGSQLEFNGRTIDCAGMAYDPSLDVNLEKMRKSIIQGEYWGGKALPEGNGIIIGTETATELGVKVGDEITILARTADFTPYLLVYKIRGIFKTNIHSLDKGVFYIHINDAENLLNMYDQATEILIMIKDKTKAKEYAVTLKSKLEKAGFSKDLVLTGWLQQSGLEDMFKTFKGFMFMYLLVFSLVAGLIILNTMLMSITERTREIGMMLALGMKKLKIMGIVLVEGIYISIIGSIIGGGIGSLVSYFYFEKIGMDFTEEFGAISDWLFDPVIRGDFRIEHFFYGLIFGVILAIVSSIYPAWRASRMKPVDALRSI